MPWLRVNGGVWQAVRMIVAFEKTARVRHLGHLDLMRAMQRALRRSGLPIRYSQGFNPHVVLSFASPLPVGTSGSEELMDVALDADVSTQDFTAQLSVALPESLPMVSVRIVDDRHPKLMAQLETAAYEVVFPISGAAGAMASMVPVLLERAEISAIRKTKSGEKPCDIRPMIHQLSTEQREDLVLFHFRTSLTEKNTLKPALLLQTLSDEAGVMIPADGRIHRVQLLGERDGTPVPLMEM